MAEISSLVDLLHRRAAEQPHDRAYVFLTDKGGETDALSFGDLQRRAAVVAARLAALGAQKGDRAALIFPTGPDFIVAFFGCLIAGVIAVPMMPPRRTAQRDAAGSIIANCSPRFALINRWLAEHRGDALKRIESEKLACIVVDGATDLAPASSRPLGEPGRGDVAFLQYTSGSTSAPKGVMVTHGNLIENLEMIRIAMGHTRQSTHVTWVPFYHDMGLILNLLETLYLGALCVVLAPTAFVQRPLHWLRAISDYKAEVASGPNFAYDLCVSRYVAEQMAGVDLQCWKIAANGAEPVRAGTIAAFCKKFAAHGFAARSTYPAYGMAEATLMISGGARGAGATIRNVSREALQRGHIAAPRRDEDSRALVGCGQPVVGEEIAIVEPETLNRLSAGSVGEIWLRGPHVAIGYWQNADATTATFKARIAGEGDGTWLRTGDLGFLDETGELYITGRIKDLIIVYGENHYPADIEDTAQSSHPALRRNCGAAFSVFDRRGEEKLVLVQEIEREWRQRISLDEIESCIRQAVMTEHEISVHKIALIMPGRLPKTTSGKIQRNRTRELWQQGALETLPDAVGNPAEP